MVVFGAPQKLNNHEQQKLIDKSIEDLGSALKN